MFLQMTGENLNNGICPNDFENMLIIPGCPLNLN